VSRGPSRTSSSTTRADSGVDPVRRPAPSVRRYGLPAKSESIEIALRQKGRQRPGRVLHDSRTVPNTEKVRRGRSRGRRSAGSRDVLGQMVGVDRRNHDVAAAIDHQGRLSDRLQFRERLTTWLLPVDDRGCPGLHRLLGCGRIHVHRPLMAALPESFTCGLAGLRRYEE